MKQLLLYLYHQTQFPFSQLESTFRNLPPFEYLTTQSLIAALLSNPKASDIHAELRNKTWEAKALRYQEKLNQYDIQYLSIKEDRYPSSLKNIASPPPLLFYQGQLPNQDLLSIAMVGARRATPIGCQVARELAESLAQNNTIIVSGLAEGIDTAAHEGTLNSHGKTIAVLGCGLFKNYPASNLGLRRKIIHTGGCIFSEFPAQMAPLSYHFPRRNRIISGLSRGVIVVEAGVKSGSLITAKYALEQNRDVFAVPGSLKNPVSQGPNKLIKLGAIPVTEAQDILDHYMHIYTTPASPQKRNLILTENETQIFSAIQKSNGISFDALVAQCQMPVSVTLSAISSLEINECIEKLITGDYIVKL